MIDRLRYVPSDFQNGIRDPEKRKNNDGKPRRETAPVTAKDKPERREKYSHPLCLVPADKAHYLVGQRFYLSEAHPIGSPFFVIDEESGVRMEELPLRVLATDRVSLPSGLVGKIVEIGIISCQFKLEGQSDARVGIVKAMILEIMHKDFPSSKQKIHIGVRYALIFPDDVIRKRIQE